MKIRKEQFYESPQMKVFETKAKQLICTSPNGTEQYGNGTWNI